MAKQATFDIVSEVNMQEVDNAVNQSTKEISQRYDFKDSKTNISIEKDAIQVVTEDDMRLKSVIDILQSKLIRRGVPINNLTYGAVENTTGGVKQEIGIKQGIEGDVAKKISKDIKNMKLKVQTQYMDDKIRVSGKKIDDLQAVIAALKEQDYDIDLQFENFRS